MNQQHQHQSAGYLKGIVDEHLKNEHSVIIYSPSISKPVWISKEDILKNVGNRAVLGHHWLPYIYIYIYIFYYGCQWCPKTAWLQTFFKISSFVFGRTKKFIQVWNYLRVSKWWQNFHFWVNYPFNHKYFIWILIELDPGWFWKNTLLLL